MTNKVGGRPQRKIKLGELLIAAGVIDETKLQAALSEQRKWGGKLGRTLVDMGFLSEDLMVKALSRQLGIPESHPDKDPMPEGITQHLGVQFCERYGVIPVAADTQKKLMHIATADPTNYEAFDEISFKTGMKIEPCVAPATAIDRAIRKYYYGESIEASRTASPDDFGSREQMIDFSKQAEASAQPARAPAAPAARAPAAAPAADPAQLADAKAALERLERLERGITGEVRALRALVELLIEKGVISRDEYLARVRGRE